MRVRYYLTNYYALPLSKVCAIIMLSIVIWICLSTIFNPDRKTLHRVWRGTNLVVLLLSVALIAEKTLLGRSTGNRELQLIPFYTFTTVSYNNEAIRGLLMNTVLFLPFGLTIPHLLEIKEKNNKARWCMSVLSGLGISILVECLQFVFGIGRAETDDVICNTLGCALGVSADIVATVIITKIKLRKK